MKRPLLNRGVAIEARSHVSTQSYRRELEPYSGSFLPNHPKMFTPKDTLNRIATLIATDWSSHHRRAQTHGTRHFEHEAIVAPR